MLVKNEIAIKYTSTIAKERSHSVLPLAKVFGMHGTSTATFQPRDVTSYYIIRAPDRPLHLSCKILLNIAFVHKTSDKGETMEICETDRRGSVCEKNKDSSRRRGILKHLMILSQSFQDSKCSCNRGCLCTEKKKEKVLSEIRNPCTITGV